MPRPGIRCAGLLACLPFLVAIAADAMPIFGYGCAVFMQSDIVNFQRQGWAPKEILAGLAAVLPKNIFLYVASIPNLAKLGSRFVLQGGTQHNLAAVKAEEIGHQIREMTAPTRMYQTYLPAFPEVYRVEVRVDAAVGGRPVAPIVWDSPVPRPRQQNRVGARVLDYPNLGSDPRASLRVDQRALAREAPAVTTEAAVTADHAMAGDQNRDAVARAGGGDRTRRARRTDRGRGLRVRHDFAGRDPAQIVPDTHLERGAAQVERQRRARRMARFFKPFPNIMNLSSQL